MVRVSAFWRGLTHPLPRDVPRWPCDASTGSKRATHTSGRRVGRSARLRFLALFGAVVARLAQWLPVVAIPEQNHVSTVRNAMVDHLGGCHSPRALAIAALRMRPQKTKAGLLPFIGVAALGGGALICAPRAWLQSPNALPKFSQTRSQV